MKKKIFKKASFIFALSLAVFLVFTGTNTYAASVGEKLTSPEDGWRRYDESHSKIKYEGVWLNENNAAYLNGSVKYSQFNNTNSRLVFKFKGTKLRILGPVYNNKPTDIPITIDGTTEIFSGYTSTLVYNHVVLLYEKTGLADTVHTVTIETPPSVANIKNGNIAFDAIDIDEDGYLVDINTPIGLNASADNSQVTLNWDQVENAESYTVYYGTESGKYTEKVSVTKDAYENYVVPGLTNGTTYYFVVTATVNGVESDSSNEASATPNRDEKPNPEQPSGNRAILVVTMSTGLEKEFDLSMKEVNDFIDWYEAKQAGSGKASYAIDKHENNKGPFTSRKDYILFDRVLTFEVSEYNQ